MSDSAVVTGKVAFSNLTEHESYMGQSTGKYSLVITLDAENAAQLSDAGIRLKDYNDTQQRKFSSKFVVPVVDMDDQPHSGEIPRGSVVRILYKNGDDHPQWGVTPYLNRVRLVELAEFAGEDETPEEF